MKRTKKYLKRTAIFDTTTKERQTDKYTKTTVTWKNDQTAIVMTEQEYL